MSKIINFPNAVQKSRGKGIKPIVEAPNAVNNHMHLGPWDFTCTRCATKTSFETHNMIFRSVDFYCASCGALHRVTNPAFTPIPPTKK